MALSNPLETFVWGAGGARKTPEEIARDREIAAALMAQGVDTSPVGHWTQGAARVVGALGGVLKERRANKASERNAADSQARIAKLLGGLGGGQNSTGYFPPAPGSVPGASPSVGGAQPQISSQVGGGEIESYIRKAAEARGIDPNVAVAVAKSEGGLKDPFRQSDIVKNGIREQSYGPFQLYMGGGLGNKALEKGIDPRKDWKAGIDFALDQAATGGWGPWYGAKAIGVTGMHGIGQRPPQQVASLDPAAGMPAPQMPPAVDPAMNGMAPPNPSRFAPDAQPVVPGIPGQQTMPLGPQDSGKPQGAGSPGEVRRGADGQTYQYVETTGMAGATGSHGWIPVNVGALQGGPQTAGLAAAQPQQTPPMGQPASGGVPMPEMAGNAPQPVQMAQNGNNMQAIIEALSSPYASPQERDIAGILLKQAMTPPDPNAGLEAEYKRMQIKKLESDIATANSPDARKKFGLNPQYGVDAEGNPVLLQLGENGQAMQTALPPGVKLSKEPIKIDAGTHWILLDPITRQPVGQVSKNVAGEAAAAAGGKAQGEAQVALPQVEAGYQSAVEQIDQLMNHPGLNASVGTIQGQIPDSIAGALNSDVADFRTRLNQAKGQTFLRAFEALKGGGAITEIEGLKAEQAIGRLNQAVSETDFKTALNDLKAILDRGMDAYRRKAGVVSQPPDGWQDMGGGVRIRVKPQ